MKNLALILLASLAGQAFAADALPPEDSVARTLRNAPAVQAAQSQVRVEEANRDRLHAGPYEWNVRLGSQQRRSMPSGAGQERFSEWNAALERPVRLPGKAALDGELGTTGVNLAESALGDALHEAGRDLLKTWFTWLRENAAVSQWTAQAALLEEQTRGIRRRQQLGDAARLDTVQAEAAQAQATAQLTQARTRLQMASEDLRRRFPELPLTAPAEIPAPQPVDRDESSWIEAILNHNHELAVARGETRRSQLLASRSQADRLPDPSLGVQFSRERGGEEQVVGAYISIPLPGGARRASASAAEAHAEGSSRREASIARRISAEAANLYHAARAGQASWQAAREAADSLGRAAEMTARAYQLGEGSLNELLAIRRLANEARLNARLSQLDALELHYRLRLDAHELWDLD